MDSIAETTEAQREAELDRLSRVLWEQGHQGLAQILVESGYDPKSVGAYFEKEQIDKEATAMELDQSRSEPTIGGMMLGLAMDDDRSMIAGLPRIDSLREFLEKEIALSEKAVAAHTEYQAKIQTKVTERGHAHGDEIDRAEKIRQRYDKHIAIYETALVELKANPNAALNIVSATRQAFFGRLISNLNWAKRHIARERDRAMNPQAKILMDDLGERVIKSGRNVIMYDHMLKQAGKPIPSVITAPKAPVPIPA